MAEFHFYGNWVDSQSILEVLVRMNVFEFVISKWYTAPQPSAFKTLSERTLAEIRENPRLYLWSPTYSQFPLDLAKLTADGPNRIDPTQWGPTLDVLLPDSRERNGRRGIVSGWLAYQGEYQNPNTGMLYGPPESLKHAFRDVRSFLTRYLVKCFIDVHSFNRDANLVLAAKTIWIGPDAAKELETNEADILVHAVWRRGGELRRTRVA